MLILTIRTDKPEAEIGLYDNEKQLAYYRWQAHHELSETLHLKIKEILYKEKKSLDNIGAIITYKGPGSFTGLRIGISAANALAYSLKIPIVGATGDRWLEQGIQALQDGKNDKLIIPEYGALPHITEPKH